MQDIKQDMSQLIGCQGTYIFEKDITNLMAANKL